MASLVDHAALFAATPSPYLVLGPDLVIVDVNRAYLAVTGRTREDLLGRHVFNAFPDNPADPEADGVRNLGASLHRVLATRQADTMALQKYDIPVMGRPGVFEERWWSPVNTPVLGPDGQVDYIIHRVEDVTEFVKAYQAAHPAGVRVGERLEEAQVLEAELYARARELQRLNEELRQAHTREREVAVTLQEAMLHAPDLAHHRDIAVRYLPATGSLNVCGDWYDVVDIPPDRLAVAVGDVIGHGLGAAAVMGMLRSALSAAIRALERPAQALEVLGLYARSVEGALGTTTFKGVIDTRSRLITYSSAGHPPPVLAHPDGRCELLDQATDPPLGARPQHVPRPQASLPYKPGDTLVLYTDGLIERRGQDIDAGLDQLIDVLSEFGRLGTEQLADTILARLGVASGGRDDVALIVVRL
ncbi:PP2C family protein-serine/threonine phosphatase [Streptomyces camelliae]|uniref:SpoIIE family protein phosphatase n=1 Tax=Streptomyces camelliae TaxID=3004093 RepID=A0ABY7NYV2_9ACTN|nr:SpoIIE family protein phosphatase [Streptomyces sp. HUAS 2-6]WBO61766.1 SpoIIE family protein phosphatase [Streptomyces sp. HUAS 2-6]